MILICVAVFAALFLHTLLSDGRPKEKMLQTVRKGCGAYSLQMVFAARGVDMPIEDIREGIGISDAGSTMQSMRDFARRNGIGAEGWSLRFDNLRNIHTPSILFLYGDHFVVLDSVGAGDLAYIRDPADGRRVLGRDELCSNWHGDVLVFDDERGKKCRRR